MGGVTGLHRFFEVAVLGLDDVVGGLTAMSVVAGSTDIATEINPRTNDVYRVLVAAASSDRAAADLLAELQQQRNRGQRQISRALARTGSLRDDLSERDAADLVHALMSPEIYRLLVVDSEWPTDKFQEWLATTLVEQLT